MLERQGFGRGHETCPLLSCANRFGTHTVKANCLDHVRDKERSPAPLLLLLLAVAASHNYQHQHFAECFAEVAVRGVEEVLVNLLAQVSAM